MPFRWILDEGQKSESCIDPLGQEEWVEFVFDHPVPGDGEDRWYCLDDVDCYYFKDSTRFLGRLTRLFQEPEFLLGRYSMEQIKQGYWCFITAFELPDVLSDKNISLQARRDCLMALPALYQRLFSRAGFEKIAFTYWDPLTYDFGSHEGSPTTADHLNVQDIMFESLVAILRQEPKICFMSAVRGLGHLRHDMAKKAIQAGLDGRNDLSIQEHSYGLACIEGEMDQASQPQFN